LKNPVFTVWIIYCGLMHQKQWLLLGAMGGRGSAWQSLAQKDSPHNWYFCYLNSWQA